MPIIKTATDGVSPSYFEVTSVEFIRLGDGYTWRANYNAWPDADQRKTPGAKPQYAATDHDVPLPQGLNPLSDLFGAYESAAVSSTGSHFYGGQVVAKVEEYTPVEWARITQWERIKVQRDAALSGGVDTPYGRFDTDLTSIVNVIGAASIAAQAPETWSDQWILADRTVVTLNKAQLMEVGAILADFRSRMYRRGDELYNALQSAPTVEAVRAINWSPGLA